MSDRQRRWQDWLMLAALIFFLVCVGLSVTGHADLIPDTGYGGSSDNCYGRC